MSQENVEIVRRMNNAFQGGEPESALDFYDPDAEFDATDRPDGRVWHEREGVRRAMVEWIGTWRNWQARFEPPIPVADGRVLVLWREQGEGKASGLAMEEEGATLYTLRDGLIVKAVLYIGRDKALEAAGLKE